jgi:hypothetical protein
MKIFKTKAQNLAYLALWSVKKKKCFANTDLLSYPILTVTRLSPLFFPLFCV